MKTAVVTSCDWLTERGDEMIAVRFIYHRNRVARAQVEYANQVDGQPSIVDIPEQDVRRKRWNACVSHVQEIISWADRLRKGEKPKLLLEMQRSS